MNTYGAQITMKTFMRMNAEEIFEWYVENGEFDDELIEEMQKVCFNKRIEPAKKISLNELNDMINADRRFGRKMALTWFWTFDLEYSVIRKDGLNKILKMLRDVRNEWTVVAIVQSVTGLNCGFVWIGAEYDPESGEVGDECSGYGFITDEGFVIYDREGRERKDDVTISFAIFD